ncbi:alpha/beta hydrolase [Antrihabitans cavernicola]|uniref:Alpha/beta hydrolase n=1 Tax=Antrihabitans cavernicola TaxID=2495913 RepID=A0A5A7S1S6_9NOCA|nr:alpha/beta hydrolase [Spelaeibacter cavernicola]
MVVPTAAGDAHVALDGRTSPRFLLVLTHGAAGGVEAPDLLVVRRVAVELGGAVARVLQPYRVAGGRAPGSAVKQDAAWVEIVTDLRKRFKGVPLIQGGRSNGARVACRTAPELQPTGIIALAFPLHPPGKPEMTRVAELRSAGTEVVVLNGDRDPFGMPDAADATLVHALPGETHAMKKSAKEIASVVDPWLRRWSDS